MIGYMLKKMWKLSPRYDTESENEERGNTSQNEEPNLAQQLPSSVTKVSHSDSSSDSSSGNTSSSRSKRKSHSKRTFDRVDTKIKTLENKTVIDQ